MKSKVQGHITLLLTWPTCAIKPQRNTHSCLNGQSAQSNQRVCAPSQDHGHRVTHTEFLRNVPSTLAEARPLRGGLTVKLWSGDREDLPTRAPLPPTAQAHKAATPVEFLQIVPYVHSRLVGMASSRRTWCSVVSPCCCCNASGLARPRQTCTLRVRLANGLTAEAPTCPASLQTKTKNGRKDLRTNP